jgi:hypothetical protein
MFNRDTRQSQNKSYIHFGPSDEDYGDAALRAQQGDLEQNFTHPDRHGRSEAMVMGGVERDRMSTTTVVPKGSIACMREVHVV